MTNAERIRSMMDEKLADWIDQITNDERDDWEPIGCYHCCYAGTHHAPVDCIREQCEWLNGILGWLKMEVD